MTGDYNVCAEAQPESLNLLHELLQRAAGEHPDLSPADLMLFETAVIEIAGNVVEHGRPTGEVTWQFHLEVRPEQLLGRLSDNGEAYEGDLSSGVMPDVMAETGRGLAMAHLALDGLSYERAENVNHWVMSRIRH